MGEDLGINIISTEMDLYFIAIGDSKFIATVRDVNSDFAREYYRVAISKVEGADTDLRTIAIEKVVC